MVKPQPNFPGVVEADLKKRKKFADFIFASPQVIRKEVKFNLLNPLYVVTTWARCRLYRPYINISPGTRQRRFNHGQNILKLFDVLPNSPFTTSEMKPDY